MQDLSNTDRNRLRSSAPGPKIKRESEKIFWASFGFCFLRQSLGSDWAKESSTIGVPLFRIVFNKWSTQISVSPSTFYSCGFRGILREEHWLKLTNADFSVFTWYGLIGTFLNYIAPKGLWTEIMLHSLGSHNAVVFILVTSWTVHILSWLDLVVIRVMKDQFGLRK